MISNNLINNIKRKNACVDVPICRNQDTLPAYENVRFNFVTMFPNLQVWLQQATLNSVVVRGRP